MYRYMPEHNVTFSGKVNYANGHPLDGGSILAYNTETNNVYEADIDSRGHFHMAVDDFAEGVSFYIEAKSAKGKDDFYKYEMSNDTFPDVRRIALQNTIVWQDAMPIKTRKGVKPGFNDNRYFSLPGIEVKARVQSPYNTPTNKFYSTNYVDRDEIERKDYHSLYEIIQRMPGLNVFKDYNHGDWNVLSRRGLSTFGSNWVTFIIDGTRIEHGDELNNLMEMAASEIESVELLQSWQTNAVTFGAIGGCIYIKTRNVNRNMDEIRSKGIYYTPVGLTTNACVLQRAPYVAQHIGNYRLVVDAIGRDSVQTIVFPFHIVTK